jgi:hypothetical protein
VIQHPGLHQQGVLVRERLDGFSDELGFEFFDPALFQTPPRFPVATGKGWWRTAAGATPRLISFFKTQQGLSGSRARHRDHPATRPF